MKKSGYSFLPDVLVQKIQKDTIIFNPTTSKLYTFNSTAAFIIEKLQNGFTEEKIAILVSKKFNVTEFIAFKDIQLLIRQLIDEKVFKKNK